MAYEFNGKQLKVNTDYEVIVAGGGPAGVAAATAAARDGAKTLLIEATGMLGGMGTAGLVPAWTPFTDGEKIIYGGLAKRALLETMAAMPHLNPNKYDWTEIDYETLKTVYDNMVTEVGCDILFNTSVCDVIKKDDRNVESVVVANKFGLTAYKAKIFIDCTGDADLCAWADAEYSIGGDEGQLQPGTLCFIISNVDESKIHDKKIWGGSPESVVHELVADEELCVPDQHMCWSLIGPSTVAFNAGHVFDVNSTDTNTTSRAMLEGRKLARDMLKGLKKYHPAFENSYLVSTACVIGVRESRRVVGDYVFTIADFAARRSFEDEIGRNNYFVDIHRSLEERKKAAELEAQGEPTSKHKRYDTGESHGIPYRCLCPKDLDNVLVAGRCISTDRVAQGSLRVMPCCLVVGEAAGAAAAQAVKLPSADIRKVDVGELRKKLTEYDGYLPELDTDKF